EGDTPQSLGGFAGLAGCSRGLDRRRLGRYGCREPLRTAVPPRLRLQHRRRSKEFAPSCHSAGFGISALPDVPAANDGAARRIRAIREAADGARRSRVAEEAREIGFILPTAPRTAPRVSQRLDSGASPY